MKFTWHAISFNTFQCLIPCICYLKSGEMSKFTVHTYTSWNSRNVYINQQLITTAQWRLALIVKFLLQWLTGAVDRLNYAIPIGRSWLEFCSSKEDTNICPNRETIGCNPFCITDGVVVNYYASLIGDKDPQIIRFLIIEWLQNRCDDAPFCLFW